MALTLSRVDRTPRTYVLADVMATVPAGVESVQVALLPPRSGPTAATVWTTVTYASGSFDVLWVGPDADASGGLVVPASAQAWVKVTDAPLVDAEKLERITVLGGGTLAITAAQAADAAIAALLNDTTSATYAKVVALIAVRAGFGGTATP